MIAITMTSSSIRIRTFGPRCRDPWIGPGVTHGHPIMRGLNHTCGVEVFVIQAV